MKEGSGKETSVFIVCGTEGEISVHVLCEFEVSALLRHLYVGSFFLNPENTMNFSRDHLEI
jgi:hypothetical protein